MPEGSRFELPLNVLTATPGVCGGVVATDDGLPLAVRLQAGHDREALSAAAAVLGRLAAMVIATLDRGELELGVLEGEKLRLMVRPLSLGFLLVLTEPEANLGLIAREIARAAEALEQAAAAVGADWMAAQGGAA
jgi:predicted regulator of Ras-like GTPase activity (Roadblock/LC7/MglB family)